MKIELVEKIQRRGFKDGWRYKIIDGDYREKIPIFGIPVSPQRWDIQSLMGVIFSLNHDETALEHYELYQRTKFYELNEELGLEGITYQRNEEEFAKLRNEMRLKREEIIRDEEYLETTKAIRNLFAEERFSKQEKVSQPQTTSNDPSLFTIGLNLLILGSFGLALFWFANWVNKS